MMQASFDTRKSVDDTCQRHLTGPRRINSFCLWIALRVRTKAKKKKTTTSFYKGRKKINFSKRPSAVLFFFWAELDHADLGTFDLFC